MNDSFFTVCIPAGGTGTRMGTTTPKQFLELAGKPIIAHTIAVFDAMPQCNNIVIAANRTEEMEHVLLRFPISTAVQVVQGGATRQESVLQALHAVEGDDEVVLIHDAVRPCVRRTSILSVVEAIEKHGAAMLGLPARDTIKEVHDGVVTGTLDRSRIWLAQTPQGGRKRLLIQAFEQGKSAGASVTDDASLLERAGIPVAMVEGAATNMKVTTPEDLPLAEFFLQNREELFE